MSKTFAVLWSRLPFPKIDIELCPACTDTSNHNGGQLVGDHLAQIHIIPTRPFEKGKKQRCDVCGNRKVIIKRTG